MQITSYSQLVLITKQKDKMVKFPCRTNQTTSSIQHQLQSMEGAWLTGQYCTAIQQLAQGH
jgi:hypothetical protein